MLLIVEGGGVTSEINGTVYEDKICLLGISRQSSSKPKARKEEGRSFVSSECWIRRGRWNFMRKDAKWTISMYIISA
jgi:hypothetical protein